MRAVAARRRNARVSERMMSQGSAERWLVVRWKLFGGEDGGDGVGEGLVGVFEEQGDVPHVVVGEDVFVGGHAGKADAVFDLPEGFAGFVVGDADDVAVGVLLPELRGDGVHVLGEGDVVAGGAVAGGALADVEVGTVFEDVFGGAEGGLLELAVDAGGERDLNDLGFEGEGLVGGSDGGMAEAQVGEDASDDEDHGAEEAEEELEEAGGGCGARSHGVL